jgi:dihydroxyacetone kinase-like protein
VRAEELCTILDAAMADLESSRDELRELDAAIGDGDLGITVADGARAVGVSLRGDAVPGDPAGVLRRVAKSFAAANPSTMSALVAGALIAAAREVADRPDLDRDGAVDVLEAAITSITSRGGAEVGDKTILDALVPSVEALSTAADDNHAALASMVVAAQTGVEQTTGLPSARGRAAWVGQRSVGHADGGATAYVRLLQSLQRVWPGPGNPS